MCPWQPLGILPGLSAIGRNLRGGDVRTVRELAAELAEAQARGQLEDTIDRLVMAARDRLP